MNGYESSASDPVEETIPVQKKGYFKELTEEIFLEELSTCIKWSNEYGDKYVSKDYFIYGILGHKRYEYAKSREVLHKLIVDGKLQIKKNKEDKDCLYIR